MNPADYEAIRARLEAATPGPWHWAGNVDTGEPFLATWIPGAGRCQVLAIGHEDRSTTGPAADKVRSDATEYELGDPDELVDQWAHDQFGEPLKEPRLWFYSDLMAAPARDHVIFEVAPDATSRQDPQVYRGDIVGIRHPDADLIVNAPADLAALLDALDAALADNERLRERQESTDLANEAIRWKGRALAAEAKCDELARRLAASEAPIE